MEIVYVSCLTYLYSTAIKFPANGVRKAVLHCLFSLVLNVSAVIGLLSLAIPSLMRAALTVSEWAKFKTADGPVLTSVVLTRVRLKININFYLINRFLYSKDYKNTVLLGEFISFCRTSFQVF